MHMVACTQLLLINSAVQEALSVIDRVYSVSSYTVAPCGQLQAACSQITPVSTPEEITPEILDTEILPYVDGLITSTGNATISPLFAFSASTDPGQIFTQVTYQCHMPNVCQMTVKLSSSQTQVHAICRGILMVFSPAGLMI